MPTAQRCNAPPDRSARLTPLWSLNLLDAWQLRRGRVAVRLHRREQRLVTLLALQGSRPRGYVAGVLWPESTEQHATGNLRAAVWRTDQDAPGLLVHDRLQVGLRAPLRSDVEDLVRCARRVLAGNRPGPPLDRVSCLRALPLLLRGELLPGWYDDWASFERARLTQLRLQALELLADRLLEHGEVQAALVAASAAVTIEPLHEPATRVLVRAEIDDGNYSGALLAYDAYRSRVVAELGVPPSERLTALVRPLLDARAARPRREPVPIGA